MAAAAAALPALGVLTKVAGGVLQYVGARKASKARKKAERLRQRQMELDTKRRQRDILRKAIAARASTEAAGDAQGALFSSGFAGGLAQTTASAGRSGLAQDQNLEIGGGIFSANAKVADAQGLSATGAGLSSLGGSLLSNAETFRNVGASSGSFNLFS